ncbi:LPXTG cell wall anchor domain-containing protein [Streptomyces sp. NPDC050161]|uniref:LPXTG cell wall anchor domain-containing protein n=1 Tax=Streptomyces sp. NPDC050161 TaxID=3365604 RepID=UPI00378F10BC
MTDNSPSRHGRPVVAALAAGLGALVLLTPATASAAGNSPAPLAGSVTGGDRAAAGRTLGSQDTTDRLAAFFVHLRKHKASQHGTVADAKVTRQDAAAQAPELVGSAVPVYSLDPGFVRGDTASAPVARFAYLAAEARSASGARATVWTVRDAHTHKWAVANVLSGADELTYTHRAKGAAVFTEPQIAAWYKLSGNRVLPLNDSARQSVGSDGISTQAYRKLVHTRYADKLAGSDYQRSGKLGGFSPRTASAAATPEHTSTGSSTVAATTAAGGGLLLGGGAYLIRRHRRGAAPA